MTDLDPRCTFDTFVVGPANRLASAAARRAAESPGKSYNPLFLYSASGLGKSHILMAISYHLGRLKPDTKVVYEATEGYLEGLTKALEAGKEGELRDRYKDLDVLLLDDVQFLTGQTQAQEMLLRTLDVMTGSDKQVVLASDRAPADINGLDARLVSRFSGGLIVDIGVPEYETRVAIMRKKAEEQGASLEPGVAELIARHPFKNVRELQGRLNRILAIQELEDRAVTVEDVERILGNKSTSDGPANSDEFGEFLGDITDTMAVTIDGQEAGWRKALRDMAEEAEGLGVSASRVRRLMDGDVEPVNVDGVIEEFRQDVTRLRQIRSELDDVGNPWHEAAEAVLRDPERLEEAESLLASACERVREFPVVPDGPTLHQLSPAFSPLAVRSAERLVVAERPDYNPLYITCREGGGGLALLRAAARTLTQRRPDSVIGLISAAEFAEDFIRALSAGVAGAWRERWWTVELLLMHGIETFSDTERAQDEVFHLFETLKRRGARILLASAGPPSELEGIDERLRSRFEGGLVLEVDTTKSLDELEEAAASVPDEAPEKQLEADPAILTPVTEELAGGLEGGRRAGGARADRGCGGGAVRKRARGDTSR